MSACCAYVIIDSEKVILLYMARLPIPGSDNGTWGAILNDFLGVELNSDGILKASGSLASKVNKSGDTMTGALSVPGGAVVPSGWYNVKVYGATGDGSTDDTSAIQSAISAIPSTGGTLYIPAGTYKISSAVELKSNLVVQGDGIDCTKIAQSGTSANGLHATNAANVDVRDLRVGGPASGTGVGIYFEHSSSNPVNYINITNVNIRQFGSHGLRMDSANASTLLKVISQNNGGHGFYLVGDLGVAGAGIAVSGCYANDNTSSGYYLDGMVGSSLSGCLGRSNAIDYNFINCRSSSCTSCVSNGNGGVGWQVSGGYGLSLLSCWLYDNGGVGVYVTSSAVAVSVIGLEDSTPGGSATACIKVDTGSKATAFNVHNTTANSFASGTTQVFNDNSGGSTYTGAMSLGSTLNVSGETSISNNMSISGEFKIGSDTNLYRVGANNLATDDSLTVGNNLYSYSNVTAAGHLGVGNSAAATTLGSVARKIEIFDENGSSLGFIPVYDSIT